MNSLQLFLPCAAGVEDYLAQEVHDITGLQGEDLRVMRGGVLVRTSWRDVMRLNLYSRLCQRVLVQLHFGDYRNEQDLYTAASQVAWEIWFTPKESFKVEITAQHSPLQSLNFAALKIKDAIADRFRAKTGIRPDVNTQWPDARIYAHLTTDSVTIYIDTSGEPLFKRGWRQDKGEAPLKETLAAAMIAASGWADTIFDAADDNGTEEPNFAPFYDPCCGSGTIAIEAAQIACNIAPGSMRRFAFEKLLPFQPHVWDAIKQEAQAAVLTPEERKNIQIFGSDVSFRMVDFANRNAERAGVADVLEFRGGDALQRMPPCDNEKKNGIMLVNPPYGDRIGISGVAGQNAQQNARRSGVRENANYKPQHASQNNDFEQDNAEIVPRFGQREIAQTNDSGLEGSEFFPQLATHWKKNYAGWTAFVLTPDMKLPSKMRLKESRRIPMWNGPIECRLFKFDMVAGSARTKPTVV
ncbi:MAG: class I SAM-dependent RNA methyltransferase [Polaromonas sp.]|jgi:putative N6-adenine-specific DNA methylase|nr:class I SAM-dependent RNA methyltransferase [Polaromonas sp.]